MTDEQLLNPPTSPIVVNIGYSPSPPPPEIVAVYGADDEQAELGEIDLPPHLNTIDISDDDEILAPETPDFPNTLQPFVDAGVFEHVSESSLDEGFNGDAESSIEHDAEGISEEFGKEGLKKVEDHIKRIVDDLCNQVARKRMLEDDDDDEEEDDKNSKKVHLDGAWLSSK